MLRMANQTAHKNVLLSPKMAENDPPTVKISARKPKHHNGNFNALEPVNPRRQRITVVHSTHQQQTSIQNY